MQHLQIVKTTSKSVTIYCNSMLTLSYAKDSKYHGKTKHIQIIYHFVKDMIIHNKEVLKHISISKMVVDPFTKPIARDAFVRHANSLCLCRI